MLHPRWQVHGPEIRHSNWIPTYADIDDEDPGTFRAPQLAIDRIAEEYQQLTPADQIQVDIQIRRMGSAIIEFMADQRAARQQPIQQPDPIVRSRNIQPLHSHGLANGRAATGAELAARRQREADALQRRQQAIPASTAPAAPARRPTPPPPPTPTVLVIRTPERPPERRTSPPEAPSDQLAPPSTAPPAVNNNKRKRTHTERWQEAVEQRPIGRW